MNLRTEGWPDDWDEFHPIDADEEVPEPEIPTIDGLPPVVDYSVAHPGDFTISGPLKGHEGNGRRFNNQAIARWWAEKTYGKHRVQDLPYEQTQTVNTGGRWVLRILAG